MQRRQAPLLPGTRGRETTPPRGLWHERDAVVQARKRADIRDIADLALLLAIDVLYVGWPAVHLPFVDRESTRLLLVTVHLLFAAWCIATRVIPRWRARRIAATWSSGEQRRFRIT